MVILSSCAGGNQKDQSIKLCRISQAGFSGHLFFVSAFLDIRVGSNIFALKWILLLLNITHEVSRSTAAFQQWKLEIITVGGGLRDSSIPLLDQWGNCDLLKIRQQNRRKASLKPCHSAKSYAMHLKDIFSATNQLQQSKSSCSGQDHHSSKALTELFHTEAEANK